jgi:serine/threonine protein kinase
MNSTDLDTLVVAHLARLKRLTTPANANLPGSDEATQAYRANHLSSDEEDNNNNDADDAAAANNDDDDEDDYYSSNDEDYSDDEEEGKSAYRKGNLRNRQRDKKKKKKKKTIFSHHNTHHTQGGYHPVTIGDVFKSRYTVLSKLGWGHFSTVWCASDAQQPERNVALKVVKSAAHYTEAAEDEIEMLKACARHDPHGAQPVVHLHDSFYHRGVHGKHVVMVFETLGSSLLDLIKLYKYKGIPLFVVKHITHEVLRGLHFLHTKCQLIHTDVKPENVLLAQKLPATLTELLAQGDSRFRRYKTVPEEDFAVVVNAPAPATIVAEPTTPEEENLGGHYDDDDDDDDDDAAAAVKLAAAATSAPADTGAAMSAPTDDASPSAPGTPISFEFQTEFRKPVAAPESPITFAFETEFCKPEPAPEDFPLTDDERSIVDNLFLTPDGTVSWSLFMRMAGEHSASLSKNQRNVTKKRLRLLLNEHADDKVGLLAALATRRAQKRQANAALRGGRGGGRGGGTARGGGGGAARGGGKRGGKRGGAAAAAPAVAPTSPTSPAAPAAPAAPAVAPAATPPKRHPYESAEIEADLKARYGVKVVDLGNACWTFKHFTDDVQTRQYRSPEVIIGAKYSTPCDLWSTACMAFELATGDLLFEPKNGVQYDKNDDHLALMIELLGPIPKKFALSGKQSGDYFDKNGKLTNIAELKNWPLINVLLEKYHFEPDVAAEFADFLLPMLRYTPGQRATAAEMLRHAWLTGADTAPTKAQPASPADE